MQWDYVYLNGRLVAKAMGYAGTNTHVFFSDALGSTRLVYNGTSQVFGVPSYKPFGTPHSASGSEKVRYAQEMQDATSTGLYYIFARYMDPELGRFISLDPKPGNSEMPQSLNRYGYCVNNPLRYNDPTGESLPFFTAIGAIYGAAMYVYSWWVSDEPYDPVKYWKYQAAYAFEGAMGWYVWRFWRYLPYIGPDVAPAAGEVTKAVEDWAEQDSGLPQVGLTRSQVEEAVVTTVVTTVDTLITTYSGYVQWVDSTQGSQWLIIQKEYPERVPFELWQSCVPSGGGQRGAPIPI